MKIAVGSDHAGFELKTHIIEFLNSHGYKPFDCGTNSGTESVDYPDFALIVANKVASGECDFGILACGTGIGMCIAANKVNGIRAASVSDVNTTRLSREHNNANILCLGGRVTPFHEALDYIEIWLKTEFAGERHERRVEKISAIEKKNK